MFASRFLLIPILLSATLILGCGKASKKPKQQKSPPANNYTFGEVIGFGRGGRSDTFKRGGWGETERELTWTNGSSARVSLTIPDSKAPLRLRMRLAGFTNPPWLPFQPVEVYVNDDKVADWQVAELGDYIAIIPVQTANHVRHVIELRLPEATSPKVLKIGEDGRMLGVCCYEFALTEANEADAEKSEVERTEAAKTLGKQYTLGTVVSFGAGAGATRFKTSGWYTAEKDFTWMGKEPALLDLILPPTERPLTLKMKLTGLTKGDMLPAQLVEVSANGAKIAEWQVGAPDEFEALIPANIVAQRRRIRIELRAPDAISPKDLGTAEDTRVLGVRCEALIITDEQPAAATQPLTPLSPSPRR